MGETHEATEFETTNYLTQVEGTTEYKKLFKLPGSSAFKSNAAENCGHLQKWEAESYIKDWRNVVIVTPIEMWYSKMSSGVGRVVVDRLDATTAQLERTSEKIYRMIWELESDGVFETPEENFVQVL